MRVNRIQYDRDTGSFVGSTPDYRRKLGTVDVVELDIAGVSISGRIGRETTIIKFNETVEAGIEHRTYVTVGICKKNGERT